MSPEMRQAVADGFIPAEVFEIEARRLDSEAVACAYDRWLGSREIAKARAELARWHGKRASLPRITLRPVAS